MKKTKQEISFTRELPKTHLALYSKFFTIRDIWLLMLKKLSLKDLRTLRLVCKLFQSYSEETIYQLLKNRSFLINRNNEANLRLAMQSPRIAIPIEDSYLLQKHKHNKNQIVIIHCKTEAQLKEFDDLVALYKENTNLQFRLVIDFTKVKITSKRTLISITSKFNSNMIESLSFEYNEKNKIYLLALFQTLSALPAQSNFRFLSITDGKDFKDLSEQNYSDALFKFIQKHNAAGFRLDFNFSASSCKLFEYSKDKDVLQNSVIELNTLTIEPKLASKTKIEVIAFDLEEVTVTKNSIGHIPNVNLAHSHFNAKKIVFKNCASNYKINKTIFNFIKSMPQTSKFEFHFLESKKETDSVYVMKLIAKLCTITEAKIQLYYPTSDINKKSANIRFKLPNINTKKTIQNGNTIVYTVESRSHTIDVPTR